MCLPGRAAIRVLSGSAMLARCSSRRMRGSSRSRLARHGPSASATRSRAELSRKGSLTVTADPAPAVPVPFDVVEDAAGLVVFHGGPGHLDRPEHRGLHLSDRGRRAPGPGAGPWRQAPRPGRGAPFGVRCHHRGRAASYGSTACASRHGTSARSWTAAPSTPSSSSSGRPARRSTGSGRTKRACSTSAASTSTSTSRT